MPEPDLDVRVDVIDVDEIGCQAGYVCLLQLTEADGTDHGVALTPEGLSTLMFMLRGSKRRWERMRSSS